MIEKLKSIKIRDILGILIFFLVLIPSIIKKINLKIRHKKLWLICEKSYMARDNGYIFYKFIKEQYPEIECYYAINKKSPDYRKLVNYDNVIQWGSIKHYFYYMCSTKNISSHKEGNPNHTLFTVLHLYLNLYNNRVFLQHGVLYQNFPMFHCKNTKFKVFITGAKPEYDYVKDNYGYQDEVRYTGLARFDNLYDFTIDNKCILLIPTWRRWLTNEEIFEKSLYFKKLHSLINSKKLQNLLNKYDKYLYFYPHASTQDYIELYETKNDRIKILDMNNVDIQKLLRKGALLVTDYSSLFTDFAYMQKPIIHYQYDLNDYYTKHCQPSTYFNFEKDGFGYVVKSENKLIEQIEYYIKNDFKMDEIHINRLNNFFVLYDRNNCERIYNEIIGDEE